MNDAKTDPRENATDYADFFIRTATIVRHEQPTARILGLALPKMPLPYAECVLKRLKEKNELRLLDELTYHPYNVNPDASYDTVEELRTDAAVLCAAGEHSSGRERFAPRPRAVFGALANARWNETGQAKWALRRLLGDLGRDIPSSYFGICDMVYPGRINHKGLLAVNDDKTVHHVKEAYYAVQEPDGHLRRHGPARPRVYLQHRRRRPRQHLQRVCLSEGRGEHARPLAQQRSARREPEG